MTKELAEKTNKQIKPTMEAIDGEIMIKSEDKNFNSEDAHKLLFGVSGNEIVNNLLSQVCNSCNSGSDDDKLNTVMPLLLDIAPKDSLEGLLAVQMIATHNMAMQMAGRAMITGQTVEGVEMNINRSAKLMRTFTAQLDTLQKYRNKGKQTIQVQHVTVNDGGQAVVGNVAGGEG